MSYDETMVAKRSEKNAEIKAKQDKIRDTLTRSQSVIETKSHELDAEAHDQNSLTFQEMLELRKKFEAARPKRKPLLGNMKGPVLDSRARLTLKKLQENDAKVEAQQREEQDFFRQLREREILKTQLSLCKRSSSVGSTLKHRIQQIENFNSTLIKTYQ